jgi:hypothetical protein
METVAPRAPVFGVQAESVGLALLTVKVCVVDVDAWPSVLMTT